MYDIGRKVYCKSQDFVGEIAERNWLYFGPKGNQRRRAVYIVDYKPEKRKRKRKNLGDFPFSYMTGSSDLTPADYQCETCDKWKANPPAATHEEAGKFCWLCLKREWGGWIS
jgi:hypothetical protein